MAIMSQMLNRGCAALLGILGFLFASDGNAQEGYYTDPAGFFVVGFPPDWHVHPLTDPNMSGFVALGDSQGNTSCNISSQLLEYSGSDSEESLLRPYLLRETYESLQGYTLYDFKSELTTLALNVASLVEMTARVEQLGEAYDVYMVIVKVLLIRRHRDVIATCVTLRSNKEIMRPTFMLVLNSMRFPR